MYKEILLFHSYFRYLVLFILALALINFLLSFFVNDFKRFNRLFTRYSLVAVSVQGIVGVILYFLSPFVQFSSDTMGNDIYRYWTLEHNLMMIIAIVLVSVAVRKFSVIKNNRNRTFVTFILFVLAYVFIIGALVMSGRGVI